MKKILFYLFGAALTYTAIACLTYRFRHPKETDTELFLHIPRAWVWE